MKYLLLVFLLTVGCYQRIDTDERGESVYDMCADQCTHMHGHLESISISQFGNRARCVCEIDR